MTLPFSPLTSAWFANAFSAPTEVQRRGWEAIAGGEHALLVAPTGSGKTLAAFLWAIDQLLAEPADGAQVPGTRVLYVSPLKALVHDVERNLRAPLAGVRAAGAAPRELRVAIRTGDTSARERREQAREPADILVTTPESLYLILGSKARANLAAVTTVIVDEVHALAPTKRGAHLALSLERLAELGGGDPQRIGLSATVEPAAPVAAWLGGDRPVRVVDASEAPSIALEVVVPVPDMENVEPPPAPEGGSILAELHRAEMPAPPPERGIWSAIYPRMLADLLASRSTIVFVNSRGLCERLTQRLNELAGEEIALAHHGSVSHERRAWIEESLKAGTVRAIVATSSLELGIDMGAVDRVILVESPGSVARGLQRVGRAGHAVGAVSAGTIYPKYRGDLLECAALGARMLRGALEPLAVPRNPLDVLAQQLVAMCCDAPRTRAELAATVRRAASYRELGDEALDSVLEMLAGPGLGPGGDGPLADLPPRLAWDRAEDRLSARRGAPMVSRLNAGTIPDRGAYAVHLGADGPRLGELDEEMVFETRAGENVLLGASTWRVEEITADRVVVSPAPGEPGRLPFWRGDGPGRPIELGEAIGALARELGDLDRDAAAARLRSEGLLDAHAAGNLAAYVHEQREATGVLPSDRAVVVERFRDELGDWRVCILTPFGARVHAPWAMALQHRLGAERGYEVQLMYTDDGIVVRFADVEELPDLEALVPGPEEIGELVTAELADSALFAGLFRENAVRSLVLVRNRPGRRTPLWAQRLKASDLLAAVRRQPAFPVVMETYRQALADVFDMPALTRLLEAIRSRTVRLHEVETPRASPFARSLVFAYVAAFIYEQDAPLAERKAQALTLDRELLADLLGQAELRELLDPEVIAETEAALAGLGEGRLARDADELHDRLRRLGDLTDEEARARAEGDAAAWLETLARQRRAARVTLAGESRWIAAEDAGLYRDALGAAPPPGLPARALEPVPDALERLLRRYARTHGPFLGAEPAARYGLPVGVIDVALGALGASGVLVRGELRPGGAEPEWCDADVLRRLKRRTLARLRHAVAPVEGSLLAPFLALWHGLAGAEGALASGSASGPARLEEAITRLEGLPVPWSALVGTLLPARVPGFRPDQLDALCASGRFVWVGRGALGARDGRVALLRRERAAALLAEPGEPEPSAGRREPRADPLHQAIVAHLETNGASFLTEIERAALSAAPGSTAVDLEAALLDLVWDGVVTNDTVAPLAQLAAPRRGRRGAALAGGRFSLVARLAAPAPSATERAVARAEMLLERYGVVSREAALAEGLPGGWTPLYRVLVAMEDAGRVRRGYFVEGLAGAQFAYPGVVDRLRGLRNPDEDERPALSPVAAGDPANPYGALLPWPETAGDGGRPRRIPGAWLLVRGDLPVLWVGPGARHLVTFADPRARDALEEALVALESLPRSGRRRLLVVEKVDGVPVLDSTLRPLLARCGFVADYRGMTLDARRPARSPAA